MPAELGSNKPGQVYWVTSKRRLREVTDTLANAPEVTFDLETTGLDEYSVTGGRSNGGVAARVSMLSATIDVPGVVDPVTYVVPLSHPKSAFRGSWRTVLRYVMKGLAEAEQKLLGHNVKFDARWVFATTGIDVSPFLHWDTQVAAHMLDENESTRLKETVPRVFGVERWDDHDLSYPGASEDVDYWELGEYAARDTYWTHKLYKHQQEVMFLDADADEPLDRDEVLDARLGKIAMWVSMPTVRTMSAIEQRGMHLDTAWVERELEKSLAESREAMEKLAEDYDLPIESASTAANSKWFISLTEKAIDRGELRILSTTPTGNPKWGKHELSKLARSGMQTAENILTQRQGAKRAEYLVSWLDKVTPVGSIHATYNIGRVATGRLSSSDPNMQQVTPSLRPAFIPRPGRVIVDLDYSQLELRVAAHIARSGPMIRAFQEGQDLHRLLAASINGVSLEEVTAVMRQAAKAANFGLLYGQGPEGFRNYAEAVYGVILTEEESVAAYNHFFDSWVGMREWHDETEQKVRAQGFVTSPIGRVRRLPEAVYGDKWEVSKAVRQALNAPVQGFGADLMNMAAASINGTLPGVRGVSGAYPVGTVHDSLIVEIEEDGWEERALECKHRMENLDTVLERMNVQFDVPLVAEYDAGTRWGLADLGSSE